MDFFRIFIVEDDPWYGEMLKYHLSLNPDYDVRLFNNGTDCVNNLHLKPQVICIDYNLPDMTGDRLFSNIKSYNSLIPVIVISGQDEISVAIRLLKNGAHDYIIKDDNAEELLWNSILHIRENNNLRKEVDELKEKLETKYDFENTIIGTSKAIKNQYPYIKKAIDSNINVLITGETGTGKEVVAKAIHYSGPRRKKPFVAINMAAIPRELIESELFGHEKGAFTGAVSRKPGKFEQAKDGTIFLDEIAELDITMQVKLLRALQEREIVRVGGNEVIKINARIISATHQNLGAMVKEGRFRQDLYYRIIGLPIDLPPLRDRGNDILILAKHFIDEYSKENKIQELEISSEAQEKLLKYSFPGNVRELKSVIDLACVLSNEKKITAENITFQIDIQEDDLFTKMEKTLKEYNEDIINYFLTKYNDNVMTVAKKLDIGKSTIYNMRKALKDKKE